MSMAFFLTPNMLSSSNLYFHGCIAIGLVEKDLEFLIPRL
jgi:hypothetical protein